jgi:hypothetical protein
LICERRKRSSTIFLPLPGPLFRSKIDNVGTQPAIVRNTVGEIGMPRKPRDVGLA